MHSSVNDQPSIMMGISIKLKDRMRDQIAVVLILVLQMTFFNVKRILICRFEL